MADATTAARDRIDRALAELEKKIAALKSRPVIGDDDLFAPRPSAVPANGEAAARIADLEAAGHAASEALAQAADEVRALLTEQEA
jgi:hypothetical protein